MGRMYAGVLGPIAFLTIVTRSLIEGGAAVGTMQIATLCLFLFAGVGYVIGQIGELVVWDSVHRRFDDEMRSETEVLEQPVVGEPEARIIG